MSACILQRLRGREVTMVTGTDEHGEKIALSAVKAGLHPKAHCDAVVAQYKQLWQLVRSDVVSSCMCNFWGGCCTAVLHVPCFMLVGSCAKDLVFRHRCLAVSPTS